MAKSTKALLTGRIQMCKTNPSIAHIGLATHGRSIQIGSSHPELQPEIASASSLFGGFVAIIIALGALLAYKGTRASLRIPVSQVAELTAVVRSDSHHEHSTAINLPSLQVREHLVDVVQPSFMDFSSDLTLRRECDCFC